MLKGFKSKFLRGISIKKITGKKDYCTLLGVRFAVISVRKQPQLSRYQLLHELGHLKFRKQPYTIFNEAVNLLEDYIINKGLPPAIKLKLKHIRKNSRKCPILNTRTMQYHLYPTPLTKNMKKVLSMLSSSLCRKILRNNSPRIRMFVQLAHEILCDELVRIIKKYESMIQ